jgi:hypothetical protein
LAILLPFDGFLSDQRALQFLHASKCGVGEHRPRRSQPAEKQLVVLGGFHEQMRCAGFLK